MVREQSQDQRQCQRNEAEIDFRNILQQQFAVAGADIAQSHPDDGVDH